MNINLCYLPPFPTCSLYLFKPPYTVLNPFSLHLDLCLNTSFTLLDSPFDSQFVFQFVFQFFIQFFIQFATSNLPLSSKPPTPTNPFRHLSQNVYRLIKLPDCFQRWYVTLLFCLKFQVLKRKPGWRSQPETVGLHQFPSILARSQVLWLYGSSSNNSTFQVLPNWKFQYHYQWFISLTYSITSLFWNLKTSPTKELDLISVLNRFGFA